MTGGFTIGDRHPPKHAKYVVLRDCMVFTATPCYGMHPAWWVVTTMGEGRERTEEAPPTMMDDEDRWWPLEMLVEEWRREWPDSPK